MAHSSNVFIHGSTFNSAQGDIHNNNKDSGFHILQRLGVSLGAIHDSAERYPLPNYHPDTRKAVRQVILDWIHNESSASLFWLYGTAAAGNTVTYIHPSGDCRVSVQSIRIRSEFLGSLFLFQREEWS